MDRTCLGSRQVPHTSGELQMLKSHSFVMIIAAALLSSPSWADDLTDAAAASEAFYNTLTVLDDGAAMSHVFAPTPYVTFVGPRTKDIIVGWPKLNDYFKKSNAMFTSRQTTLTKRQIHVNGNLAWEIGLEVGENELKDGKKIQVNWVATNVFEKQADGKWLMVSHHVQPGSQ
jgi:ketosteroid isomerase-like protein